MIISNIRIQPNLIWLSDVISGGKSARQDGSEKAKSNQWEFALPRCVYMGNTHSLATRGLTLCRDQWLLSRFQTTCFVQFHWPARQLRLWQFIEIETVLDRMYTSWNCHGKSFTPILTPTGIEGNVLCCWLLSLNSYSEYAVKGHCVHDINPK